MRVTVLCWGHLTDYFGSDGFEVELPEGSTIQTVVTLLEQREPKAAGLTRRCRYALDEEYAPLETPLYDGCTVAILPPMSGG